MLNLAGACRRNYDPAAVANDETTAASRTSTGRDLRVSLDVKPPPASSFFYYDWPGSSSSATGADDDEEDSASTRGRGYVLAAHGDSVLLNVIDDELDDYFVYTAGAAAGKPPSLTLLPDPARKLQISRWNTGLLRRGDDELLVVKLCLAWGSFRVETADMWTHRLGSRDEWEVKRDVPIVLNADDEKLPSDESLQSFTTVPVGDRFMCWVDYRCGLVVCDMAAAEEGQSLKLRYVQLPVVPDTEEDDGCGPNADRLAWDICAADDRAVRFVSVDPRCCCGHSPSTNSCPHSYHLFALSTWTLALTTAEEKTRMAWVKGNTFDCEELWAHPGYKGLPRTLAEYPVVSAADSDVVCFMVRQGKKKWMVQVNTKNKAVLSTVRWTADVPHGAWLVHVAAKFPWLTSDTPDASL